MDVSVIIVTCNSAASIAAGFGLSFYEKSCCIVFPARNMEFVLQRK